MSLAIDVSDLCHEVDKFFIARRQRRMFYWSEAGVQFTVGYGRAMLGDDRMKEIIDWMERRKKDDARFELSHRQLLKCINSNLRK